MKNLKPLSEYHRSSSCFLPEEIKQQVLKLYEQITVCDGEYLPFNFKFSFDDNKLILEQLSTQYDRLVDKSELDALILSFENKLPASATWVTGVFLFPLGECIRSTIDVLVPPDAWEFYHLITIKEGLVVSCEEFDDYEQACSAIE